MAKKKTNGKGNNGKGNNGNGGFKSGEEWTGNPGGQPSRKQWGDALRLAMNRVYIDPETGKPDKGGATYLVKIAERVVIDAAAGNYAAINEVGNRSDGRPITYQNIHEADEPFVPEETEEERIFENAKYFASAVQQAMGEKKGKGKPH